VITSRSSRARDPDVEEAALLLDARVRIRPTASDQRAHVRQELLLRAGDEHDRELEPLRGVQRHQRRALRGLVERVRVADERDVLEETAHSGSFSRNIRPKPAASRDEPVVLRGVREELLDVRLAVDAAVVVHLAIQAS
jgi:hypothetical protein